MASAEYMPPQWQAQPHMTPPETWTLTLNRYQRDNLLMLLQVCGYGNSDSQVAPFHLMNTGDWIGEIHNMLGARNHSGFPATTDYKPRRPNVSVEHLREAVKRWLAEVSK